MTKILFTTDEINTIIELYTKQGKTQQEIGDILGYTRKTIRRVLKENDIPTNIRRVNRTLNEEYFMTINNPSKAYLVGLLFADGSIAESNGRETSISIQLLTEDINLLEFFKAEINSLGIIHNNKDGTSRFSIRSNKMAKDLSQYNVIPSKTYVIKELPKNIPTEYYLDFLRGYIDGDGSLYFSNNSFHLSITSHFIELIQDYINIVSNILHVDLSTRLPTRYNNVAKFTLNGKQAVLFADLLYKNANIYCKRKYNKYLLAKQQYNV